MGGGGRWGKVGGTTRGLGNLGHSTSFPDQSYLWVMEGRTGGPLRIFIPDGCNSCLPHSGEGRWGLIEKTAVNYLSGHRRVPGSLISNGTIRRRRA